MDEEGGTVTEKTKHDVCVLCVEDSPVIREVLQGLLSRRVRRTVFAVDGKAGLQSFLDERPEIVITDISMPLMDGLTMLRHIRRLAPDVQVIMVTGHEEASTFIAAIEVGVDRYVLKPVKSKNLYAAIDRCASIVIHKRENARHQADREKRIGELQQALEQVKTLTGFVPICASCKKIREENGEWTQLEKYLQARLDARFSHGICPECKDELYPEIAEALREKRKQL